ncbi:MAG: L,D-transpeptidase family protein [Caulobacteraceae bacterium]|nr:L,D-transpeptidase family protein [Caulobacteraceae bacterium]
MIFVAHADGRFDLVAHQVRCALGRRGVRPAADKREGDGASPAGVWPLRRVLWRADRLARPATALPVAAIAEDDGWCDAPDDRRYNRPVRLPYPASAERLWLDETVYDVVVVLGHNDDPPVAGMGSAIFLHVARPDYTPTAGCVALSLPDILQLLALAEPGDTLEIRR